MSEVDALMFQKRRRIDELEEFKHFYDLCHCRKWYLHSLLVLHY